MLWVWTGARTVELDDQHAYHGDLIGWVRVTPQVASHAYNCDAIETNQVRWADQYSKCEMENSMFNFGQLAAIGFIFAASIFSNSVRAQIGPNCGDDLTTWPTSITYEPPTVAGELATIWFDPPAFGHLRYGEPWTFTVEGDAIVLTGDFANGCTSPILIPERSSYRVPALPPGEYTVSMDLLDFPVNPLVRTLVVGGGAVAPDRHAVPAVSPYSLAAGILAVMGLFGWRFRRDRLRTRDHGS